ncbi:hypothetical protein Ddye_016200 [Dipteronia dyeriana]|uniref:DUF1985 domain-containing protein n=1 Tax=Dipteronia dyeriana TaxID=168575 RepID=A0AAD9U6Z5_9ROSI|nr:hypothetical protein Ddye_016200 [Dipteronia dyeriana]
MRIRLRDSLKTVEGDWYEGKLTRHNHFNALDHIDDALNRVPVEFTDEDRHRFMVSCFGHFLMMHREMKFLSGIIHRLLLRELHHNGPTDEIQFMLGNQLVRFSKVEFCLITGLRFGVVPDTTKYAAVENGIHEWYFPGADEVSLEEIRGVITATEFGKTYDAFKLCLLYMLNWILIGVDERFKIPVWQCRLVEDLDAFPWGAHIFVLEVIPDLAKEVGARRATDLTPRILKWELTKQPRGKKLAKIFKARTTLCGISGTEGGGLTDKTIDSEGYETDPQRERHRHRHRRVWFSTPGHGTSTGDSRGGVRRDREVHPGSVVPPSPSTSIPPPPSTLIPLPPSTSIQPQRSPPPPSTSVVLERLPHPPSTSVKSVRSPPLTITSKRLVKRRWHLMSPYTYPYRPKRLWTRPESVEHIFDPFRLVDANQLAAYKAFKRNINGELYKFLESNRILWFCIINTILSMLVQQLMYYIWERMMPRDSHGAVTTARRNVLQSRWLEEDLLTVRGATTSGNRPWHEVDLVLILCNIGGQHWLVVTVDLSLGKIDIFDP